MDKLSITNADQEINLKANKADRIAESVKVGIKAVGSVADKVFDIAPIGSIVQN